MSNKPSPAEVATDTGGANSWERDVSEYPPRGDTWQQAGAEPAARRRSMPAAMLSQPGVGLPCGRPRKPQ
eukprot:5364964-Amphidinium_carterae.1